MTDWYDPEATLASVLWTLRLTGEDVDAETIAGLIPAAARRVSDYLDPVDVIPGPPPEPGVQVALEATTIALYHRGATNATVGATAASLSGTDDPFDPLRDIRGELVGHKQQWGIG